MSFLEQRRGSFPTAAFQLPRLTQRFLRFLPATARHWPLCWAVVYLAGFGLGGKVPAVLPNGTRASDPETHRAVARATTVLPVLFTFVPGAGVLPVWLGVMAGGYLAGSLEAVSRQTRRTAQADPPCSVAVPLVWEGPAVMRVTGWPASVKGGRWRAPARLVHLGAAETGDTVLKVSKGQGVMLSGEGRPPVLGTMVEGWVQLCPPSSAPLIGAFDYRQYLAGRGLTWRGKLVRWKSRAKEDPVSKLCLGAFHPLRMGLVTRIKGLLPEREAAVASAVLLGIREQESRLASQPFADLGLAHLFAVSGLHVGVLLGIFLWPLRKGGCGPWGRVGPILVLLPTYVLLTGMPGSVVRAAGLGFLVLLAGALGKPSQPLRWIGLLFWVGTIWDPGQNLDTGLKLSYLAAGGILAVSNLTDGFKFHGSGALQPLCTGLAVSCAAQWFTLPVVAASFGRISLLSPLANLVAVPLFSLAVWFMVMALVVGEVWSAGAQSIAAVAWLVLRFLAGLAGYLSGSCSGFPLGLPFPHLAGVLTWILLTGTGLLVLHRHRHGRLTGRRAFPVIALLIGSGLFVLGPASWVLKSPDRVTAWQFDVGQGDCGLLVFPDGWSLLIDTGGSYSFSGKSTDGPMNRTVRPFLQRNGVTRLDAVILTHGHRDHTGGAAALAEGLEVDRWLVSGRADLSLRSIADSLSISRPEAGLVLHRWGQWKVSAVYPPCSQNGNLDENDRSLVVVLSRGKQAMAVWTGDLEHEGEDLLLGLGGAPQGVQVWKAGHHGSNTSGTRPWLDRLDPDLILISCGVGNVYGHPNHGPYLSRGDTVAVARTDLQGTIVLEWDRQGRLAWYSMVTKPRQISPP